MHGRNRLALQRCGRSQPSAFQSRNGKISLQKITQEFKSQSSLLQDHVARGYHYEAPRRLGYKDVHRTILSQEIEVFEDLLRKIFKYEPDEHLPAGQMFEM